MLYILYYSRNVFLPYIELLLFSVDYISHSVFFLKSCYLWEECLNLLNFKKKSIQTIPYWPHPQLYVTTTLVSIDLPVLDISYNWNQITCGCIFSQCFDNRLPQTGLQNIFQYSSRGQKSKIKGSTGFVPSGGSEEKCIPCLHLASSSCWHPMACECITLISVSVFTWCFLPVCLHSAFLFRYQ